jgi:hypothetical protein
MTTDERTTPAAETDRWPPWRTWAIRIWYGLLGLWALSMSQWALRLGQAEPGDHFVTGAVTGWKLLAAGGVFAICWTGGRSVVGFHALVVGWAAWLLSERFIQTPDPDETPVLSAVTTVVLWLLPLVLLRPHRRQLLHIDPHLSAILLPLALAAAVPLSIYAVSRGDDSGLIAGGSSVAYDACGLGLVLAAQAVFAALRPRGSRWPARAVALVAAWIGLLAIIWPTDETSFGRGWGIALIGWALLFAAAAEIEARRDSSRPPTNPAADPHPSMPLARRKRIAAANQSDERPGPE